MKKKETIKISVALSPQLLKKLDDGNYNKNKLIVKLLEMFLIENENNE